MAAQISAELSQRVSGGASGQAGVVEQGLTILAGGRELSRVSYTFRTQADPRADWLVATAELREAVSAPYEVKLELVSPEGSDGSKLLGQPCTLRLERDEVSRTIHGIVSEVVTSDAVALAGQATVCIVPALQALALRTDCRIFQDKTVPEVLDLVLRPALQPYGRKHDSDRLQRFTYPRREYIVQYRESDLEFAERLMAEEGIWYCFEHSDEADAELLVLLDSNDCALTAKLGKGGDELPLQLSHPGAAFWQAVTRFANNKALTATGLTVHGYNWLNPDGPRRKVQPKEVPSDRPMYEPDGVTLWGYDRNVRHYKECDTDAQARMRWELLQGRAEGARGAGNVIGLCPGQKVRVSGHTKELNGDWIVTSVRAQGRDSQSAEHAVNHLEDYSNSFMCARSGVAFRPERKPKPHIQGIQLGRVVGPDGKPHVAQGGDDVHTDEYGRIQVKLTWDRSEPGSRDATKTCYLRVSQAWGGNGFGVMFLPRIGMEVIVSFIDGDPDRPIVTGCVYNGANHVPYDQPEHKTKSYIKTQSSPSGNGANELRFEDADGKEQIYVHAQRDFDTVVERDQTTDVHANQTSSVGGDQRLTVTGKRTKEVGGSKENGEQNIIHGCRQTTVTKDDVLEVGERQKHTLGKGRDVIVNEGDDNCSIANGHKTTKVSRKYRQESEDEFAITQGSSGRTRVVLKDAALVETQGELKLKNDKIEICAASGGKLLLQASEEIKLVCGLASVALTKDGKVEIVGLNVSAGTSTSTLKCDAAGSTLSGPKVTAMGQMITEVKGAIVSIGG